MSQRARKFLGALILLVFLAVYAVVAAGAALYILPQASRLVELAYYLAAGLLWVLPAGLLITWMQRPDAEE
jgi:hypothetical protein